MLLNYNFENFKSYFNKTEFSMIANSDKEHDENLIKYKKDRVSKVKVIYGPNASGKTSFIDSINFLKTYANISNNLIESNPIMIKSFKFLEDYQLKPSTFSCTFVKNDIKYAYSFAVNAKEVIDEKLDIYYSSKPTNVFTRTKTTNYKFTSDVRILNEIKTKTTKNKLFLLSAATWNYDKVKPVVDYILNDVVVLYGVDQPTSYNLDFIIHNNDMDDYKKFCLAFLNNADLSIDDFNIETKKLGIDAKQFNSFSKLIELINPRENNIDGLKENNMFNVKTIHKIKHDNNYKDYIFDLVEESIGTQEMFCLAPVLYYVFKEGKTLFIDGIDKSLHPILVKYIIGLFFNKDVNKKNAQLICNTNDTNLLDLDFLRRDEILFTDRDNKTGISELYTLSEFSPRKNENIEKAYMLGRFGAIPCVKE